MLKSLASSVEGQQICFVVVCSSLPYTCHIIVIVITIIIAASLSTLITTCFLSCNHCLRPHLHQLSYCNIQFRSYQELLINGSTISAIPTIVDSPHKRLITYVWRPMACSCCGAPGRTIKGCSCDGGRSHICTKQLQRMLQVNNLSPAVDAKLRNLLSIITRDRQHAKYTSDTETTWTEVPEPTPVPTMSSTPEDSPH